MSLDSRAQSFRDAWWREVLACPQCKELVTWDGTVASCVECGLQFDGLSDGQPDFRLKQSGSVNIVIKLPSPSEIVLPQAEVLEVCDRAEVAFVPSDLPRHLSPELASYIPRAANGDYRCLDLGCGTGEYRRPVEIAGYNWIGIDYSHPEAPLLADAHRLPFADSSFDFVISLAVLEHVISPQVMLREVNRILVEGGTFIGSVAYLVPLHDHVSYFNMTHCGVHASLIDAGFKVDWIRSDPTYLGIRAIAYTGMFAGLPRFVAYVLVAPTILVYRIYWSLRRLFAFPKSSISDQLVLNTGAWAFKASTDT